MSGSSRSRRSGGSMRCEVVQGLWAPSPPCHCVTAILATDNPPCVWTGAADGAIIRWRIPSEGQKEVHPEALLCGHSAAIADLESCTPGGFREVIDENDESSLYADSGKVFSTNYLLNSTEAVISACCDGNLCVWQTFSGHCQRKRKLPAWAGSPSRIAKLPGLDGFFCVACNVDWSSRGQASSVDAPSEGAYYGNSKSGSLASKSGGKFSQKGGVFIIDMASLAVVQVVHHGLLGMGSIGSMAITFDVSCNQTEYTVTVADAFGFVRAWSHIKLEIHGKQRKDAPTSIEDCWLGAASGKNGLPQNFAHAQTVSLSSSGKMLLRVFKSSWVLNMVVDGRVLAEDSLGPLLHPNEHTSNGRDSENEHHFISGHFLGDIREDLFEGNSETSCKASFVICTSEGAMHVYSINVSNFSSSLEVLCSVPLVANKRGNWPVSTKCCLLQHLLICSESATLACSGTPLVPDTRLTIWSINPRTERGCEASQVERSQLRSSKELTSFCSGDGYSNGFVDRCAKASAFTGICRVPILKGFGSLRKAWANYSLHFEGGVPKLAIEENGGTFGQKEREHVPRTENYGLFSHHMEALGHQGSDQKGHKTPLSKVTATLFIFSALQLPHLLIYGYNSGEILVVDLESGILQKNSRYHETAEQSLRKCLWHTDEILCLAEHSMRASESATETVQVLLSGGADCCICLWDLHRDCALLAIYRHHVEPVRQILLPPPGTHVPWSFCFVSVSEDGCVVISSLESLRAERIFPGHPGAPKSMAWDGFRGYVACLCANSLAEISGNDILYIWDVHSGSQERALRGQAAHSMFSHFCSRIRSESDVSKVYSSVSPYASPATDLELQSPWAPVVTDERILSHSSQTESFSVGGLVGLGSQNNPSNSNISITKTSLEAASVHADTDPQVVMGSFEKFSFKVVQTITPMSKAGTSKPIQGLNGYSEKQNQLFSPGTSQRSLTHLQQPIKSSCPFPGIVALLFDTSMLLSSDLEKVPTAMSKDYRDREQRTRDTLDDEIGNASTLFLDIEEGWLLRQSLAFLHFWRVDLELDFLITQELHISQPRHVLLGVGLVGDRGATTLMFPDEPSTFKLWRNSPEFCSMRSLMMVSLAERLLFVSPASSACRAIVAFYCRGLCEKSSKSINSSLELYACFWQDPSEHLRLAARSLFHCAALRAVPQVIRAAKPGRDGSKLKDLNHGCTSENLMDDQPRGAVCFTNPSSSELTEWIESADGENWISMIGGSYQDARTARIVVSAALAIWYPTLVHPELPQAVAPLLVKLARAATNKHSATAGELLAEGMVTTWKNLIYPEIPNLIADVFSLIECLSRTGGVESSVAAATQEMIRESLVGTLLPSLAMSHVPGFLNAVQNQLKTASSTSHVHLVALTAVVRMMRDDVRAILPFLSQVSSFILQTVEPGNSTLRKHCFSTAKTAIREMVRLFPMVALHQGVLASNAKLAVADAIGDLHSLAIHVYDLHSVTKLKVLDASGPPGYSSLVSKNRGDIVTGGISALSFSPDGEGLVAFSQQGLTMRWWSLGAAWWEKLSRTMVPVQCTKMILVPPSAGFSPRSSHTSFIRSLENNNQPAMENDQEGNDSFEHRTEGPSPESVDLSYRLEWKHGRIIVLFHHEKELFSVQL